MATLNIDIEKATKKILSDTYKTGDDRLARRQAEQLQTFHPELFPIIEAWLGGEKPEFEFQGITLSYIIEKEKCCYISAVGRMSLLMNNPNKIKFYKKRTFIRR